jgi:BMFP domain-containing protein YqiC
MTQTSNRMFDELARLMTDAGNVAQGVRREAETAFRSQAERWIADLDLVRRDEFDAVRELASKAKAENEVLTARIAELEARLEAAPANKPRAAAKTTKKAATAASGTAKTRRAPPKKAPTDT